MTQIVVDASSIGNILLADEVNDETEALLDIVSTAVLVEPVHWPIEACGLLLKAARRMRMSAADRDRALAEALGFIAMAELETASRLDAVIELALRYQISIYDAAYLELALRRKLPLLTSDKGLRAASIKAKAELISLT